MTQDIDRHITIVNDAIKWANVHKKNSFPIEQFKEYRRKLKRIRRSLTSNCSAAAYGESQVGKSYLMSSLLSSADQPFVIENNGKEFSFIYDLNPSGGNNAKIESTGVITRFTLQRDHNKAPGLIKIRNLSVPDIILLLADSYYNDIKINPETVLRYDQINQELDNISGIWRGASKTYDIITEDDVKDIADYIRDVIGNAAAAIHQSNFAKTIAPVIQNIPPDKWADVFSLLWNKNPEITRLFNTLIEAYGRLGYRQEVYVPFDAVLRKNGTLLKIEWLDTVCGLKADLGDDIPTTDVTDAYGNTIAKDFSKGELSSLISELTFELPEKIAESRPFLRKLDLLDFPGARSREKYKESEIATVIPKILRRGKVAYLFNKYSRALQISSVLFCHHNDQKSEPTIGETVNSWIEDNIGDSPESRGNMLRDTEGIAPLFFIATKFNIDLERTRNDRADTPESLDKHWNRFDTVFPEIIKPNRWLEQWMCPSPGMSVRPFQNIYPLRDFYWSNKNNLFDGYSDDENKSEETAVHTHPDYPGYWEALRRSFVNNDFVKQHFRNPEKTWTEIATVNNDGSKPIIRDLNLISGVLDTARRKRYGQQLLELKREINNALQVYYEPVDIEAKNKKVRLIAGDIRRSLIKAIATNPSTFGRILDSFMVSPEPLRDIAYDIIVRHTDAPLDFSAINFVRAQAGMDLHLNRDENVGRLMKYLFIDSEEELDDYFVKEYGFTLDEALTSETLTLTTVGDVVMKHIVDYWIDHLNSQSNKLTELLPHADEVVFTIITLFNRLGLQRQMAERINRYGELFEENEQCNAVGDYASLTLNNFVTSVGRSYISDSAVDEINDKAAKCGLTVDFSPEGWNKVRHSQPLIDTLQALDESADTINSPNINMEVLRKLPFWSNFFRWENFLTIALLYSSDISRCDPEANKRVKELIERNQSLYPSL